MLGFFGADVRGGCGGGASKIDGWRNVLSRARCSTTAVTASRRAASRSNSDGPTGVVGCTAAGASGGGPMTGGDTARGKTAGAGGAGATACAGGSMTSGEGSGTGSLGASGTVSHSNLVSSGGGSVSYHWLATYSTATCARIETTTAGRDIRRPRPANPSAGPPASA